MTKRVLQKLLDDGEISSLQVTKFYKGVRAFYVRALEYALDNLPLKDDLLKNASFVSYKKREDTSFSQVEYLWTGLSKRCTNCSHMQSQFLSLSLSPPFSLFPLSFSPSLHLFIFPFMHIICNHIYITLHYFSQICHSAAIQVTT